MKEKIKKMPGRIRNYFCSHMSAQVTVTVVLLLILAGLVLQIYVKNQYFNYLLRNTRSMEESMIETSTINIDANLKDIISAACNVGVNETLRVLVENTEADGILLAKEKLTLGSRMDDIAHQIGMYLIFSKLGFLGNHLTAPVAIAASSIPFVIVTLRPYFRSIPVSLDEAARLDGCGSVKAFLMVMLPAVKTGIITIMVISFLNGWNDLVYSMTFNVAETMRPLTANIYKFQSAYGTRWNCIMAYGAILVLPVILMFIFLQKYIVGGLVAGAVKD